MINEIVGYIDLHQAIIPVLTAFLITLNFCLVIAIYNQITKGVWYVKNDSI